MGTALHDIPYSVAESRWHPPDLPLLIGRSREMVDIRQKIQRLSGKNTNVLLTGETGCGKELIARAIHYRSLRGKGPLVRMSCGALSSWLLEGEFFHIRAAQGGTLFIDDIDALPLPLQVKLLQHFEEKGFLGFRNTRKKMLDIRLLAASNADLKEMVKVGAFEKELYNRLKAVHIRVSPLREKKEDIPLLVHFFLHKYCLQLKKKVLEVPGEVTDFFLDYPWPGNVGELEKAIQRAVALSDWSFVLTN